MLTFTAYGSREDYLMGVIFWQVATPEEQEEWRKLERPRFLLRWEARLKVLRAAMADEIEYLRSKAIRLRNDLNGDPNVNIYNAHMYELKAFALEEKNNRGDYSTSVPHYKGYKCPTYTTVMI